MARSAKKASKAAAKPADITTISAATTATRGRFVVSAGTNHFVSDARVASGGPGEAVTAGELLLSALASCALAVVQSHAIEIGARLARADIDVSFKRDPSDITRYEYIRLQFRLAGVSKSTGAKLVKQFTESCPIYNTLSRGGTVQVELEIAAKR